MTDEIIENWIRYHGERRKSSDPLFSACEKVMEIVEHDAEAPWLLTLELIAAAPTDQVLADIAAGPLEDLIRGSPDVFADRVEVEARRNPRFRHCLTGVWGIPSPRRERLAKYIATVKNPL